MKPLYLLLIPMLIIVLASCTLSPDQEEMMPGGVTDFSNKNAPKTIDSKDIESFRTWFVYPDEQGGYTRYDFAAEKQDDGTVELTWKLEDEETTIVVDAEFLLSLQEIIDKHKLASYNGIDKVTSGLPYEYEPSHLHCDYESGEKINFYMDGNPDSEWMGDFVELFSSVFPVNE